LGGWLTETYDWRWVFYINLPVGILAFLGISAFLSETSRDKERRFDLFGFLMLSLAVGALQLMLDRGQQKDWFSSTEIWIELGLTLIGIWVFAVHSLTASAPFIDLSLFRDRNFATSLLVISVVGMVLYATLALLPPMLQDLLGYPVVEAGTVLASRGVGTLAGMLLVGRLAGRVDMRVMIAVGLGCTILSLYQMTGYSMMMDSWPIISAGAVQGVGLGLIFVPLTTLAFATLPARLRTEGAALFSLVRNLGGSIGISVVVALLAQNAQINHDTLAANVTVFNPLFDRPEIRAVWNLGTDAGLASLNAAITAQAQMIAYVNDFKLMMVLAILVAPLLFLLRRPPNAAGKAPVVLD
jgi:DHA2 family multidrug resistance protein